MAKELGLGDDETASAPPKKEDPKYRLPRADLPTNTSGGVSGFGGLASQQSLDKLLREGRAEFRDEAASGKVWMPHRPPRPEKSEGGKRLVIKSEFEPQGDQPNAIKDLVEGVKRHDRTQVLLGVTGSGKTYTMTNVIANVQRPALILAHNKTLAAQLYQEFKSFFPHNAVEYFVSYYDYYQPEAYIARTDTYIEKEPRHQRPNRPDAPLSATRSLIQREDVIIVASVSCIYGLGLPEYYSKMAVSFPKDKKCGATMSPYPNLVQMHYKRKMTMN